MDELKFAPALIGLAATFVVGLYLLSRKVDAVDQWRTRWIGRVIVGICLLSLLILTGPFMETSMLARAIVWIGIAGICCVAAMTALVGKRFQTKVIGWMFTWLAVSVLLLVAGAEFVAATTMLVAAAIFIMVWQRGSIRDNQFNELAIACLTAGMLIVVLFGGISHAVFNESRNNTTTLRKTALPRTSLIQSTTQHQTSHQKDDTKPSHLLGFGLALYRNNPISVVAIGVFVLLGFVGSTLLPRLQLNCEEGEPDGI